ncbi:hypothetical protein BDW02DRAFT_566190 [Decorospora gaudefroyi]|uniref:Uncharacterized protein n=1 Tax=Decorospora gaudefroyi TaxID=184978 RepID=A0A6A5KMJ0_9PLEO|nr:hypothetical protein BDW02DRAFT_566190 [Decorospora gaudefroyi]
MHNIYTYRPIPMDNLILDFDMDSVTRLQQLRKVFFVATTPFAPVLEGESVETEAEYREKDLDHLRALVDVARTVKAKFQVRGRNVTVQVRLDVHPFGRYLEETIR